MDNARRAESLKKAIESYCNGNPQEILIDPLADSMHWCDANGEDFHIALAMACRHYVNELNDQQLDERRIFP